MDRSVAGRRVVSFDSRCSSWMKSGAIAAGLLLVAATGGVAHAEGVDWDAVAECESNGDWDADTGNGFYGGLQFKQTTWKEFGGTGSPADASREEQIAVANRVLAVQGPTAWPECGPGQNRSAPGTHWPKPLRSIVNTVWAWVPH